MTSAKKIKADLNASTAAVAVVATAPKAPTGGTDAQARAKIMRGEVPQGEYGGFTFHPAAVRYPRLPKEEQQALADNIKANGLQQRIVYQLVNKRPRVADGIGRLFGLYDAALPLWTGLVPNPLYFEERTFADDAEIEAFVKSANFFRRHLTSKQKRERAADELRANPSQSDRDIGGKVGVDKNTVKAVRTTLETTGEIHQLDKTVGKDGKARTTKPKSARKTKSKANLTTDDYAKMIVKLYAGAGDLFSVDMVDKEFKYKFARNGIKGVLKKLQTNPIADPSGVAHVARREANCDHAGDDAKVWKIITKTEADAEQRKAIRNHEVEEPKEAYEPPSVYETMKAAEAADAAGAARDGFEAVEPQRTAAQIKHDLQELLQDDDLARSLTAVLFQIRALSVDEETFAAVLSAGMFMANEFDVVSNTVEEMLDEYDALEQPSTKALGSPSDATGQVPAACEAPPPPVKSPSPESIASRAATRNARAAAAFSQPKKRGTALN